MSDLVVWLHEQISEDAAEIAKHPDGEDDWEIQATEETNYPCFPYLRVGKKRALAEVEFKRAILAECTPDPRPPETDAELHARFAHPAYEYATTEGPRKAWDDADVPPDGDGWELNIDAGRVGTPDAGWERFDYTEESYWRRRLPEDQSGRPFVHPRLLALAKVYADRPGYGEAVKSGE